MTLDVTEQGIVRDVAGSSTVGWTCNVYAKDTLFESLPVGLPGYVPRVNDTVVLLRVRSSYWVVGCTTPGRHEVQDVPQVSVVATMPGPDWSQITTTYASNDKDTQPAIRLYRPETPPPPTGGVLPVPAVDSRSWDGINGWRGNTRDVYQGNGSAVGFPTTSKGLWFYGGSFAPLSGATVTRLQIVVHRDNRGGKADSVPVRFWLHDHPSQPAGEPALIAPFTGDPLMLSWGGSNAATPFDLPPQWGQALVDGTHAGVGIYSTATDDYSIFLGPDRDPMSGRLIITHT